MKLTTTSMFRIGAALTIATAPTRLSAQVTRMVLMDGRSVNVKTAAFRNWSMAPDAAMLAVMRIVQPFSIQANFRVAAVEDGSIANAAAALDAAGNERVILYNPQFLDAANKGGRAGWAATGIIAHEVGHHLNGHTLLGPGVSSDAAQRYELEADKFAGSALAHLGATLQDANAMFAGLPDEATLSHPGRTERMKSATAGWCSVNTRRAMGFSSANRPGDCGGVVAQSGTLSSDKSADQSPTLAPAGNRLSCFADLSTQQRERIRDEAIRRRRGGASTSEIEKYLGDVEHITLVGECGYAVEHPLGYHPGRM